MTGIERLRALAGAWDAWGLGGPLVEIADEIERERACDEDTIENVHLIVGGVIDEMEHHILGHEGAEDSPVARWARELRRALKSDASDAADARNPSCADYAETADATSEAKKVTRDPAEDVSMSAYDLLPADERDAIAWVRERGGLDYVKSEWRSRVPRDRYERRRQRLLGHIAECETALGRRNERIEELGRRVNDLTTENAELRRRVMPEGYEWPRYEDGEPVQIGGEFVGKDGKTYTAKQIRLIGKCFSLFDFCGMKPQFNGFYGERVRRPAVLAADGKPLEAGQMVYLSRDSGNMEKGKRLLVTSVSSDVVEATTGTNISGQTHPFKPSELTHTNPEPPDSWEHIEEDARLKPLGYVDRVLGWDMRKSHSENQARSAMTHDLVRRCKALAERGE